MDRSVLTSDETLSAILQLSRLGSQEAQDKLLDLLIARNATCATRIKTLLEAVCTNSAILVANTSCQAYVFLLQEPTILAPLGLRPVSNGLLKQEVTKIATQRIPAAISTNNVVEVLRLFSILDVNPIARNCASVQELVSEITLS